MNTQQDSDEKDRNISMNENFVPESHICPDDSAHCEDGGSKDEIPCKACLEQYF